MASPTQSGVNMDELMQALSRLGSSDQRPPTQQELSVIGHFTDLRDFLGRNNANVPFEIRDDGDVIESIPAQSADTTPASVVVSATTTTSTPDVRTDTPHTPSGRK
jgi:hypothetical protein